MLIVGYEINCKGGKIMVYNFDSFIYDNLQKYIVKAINSRKIIFNNGENLLLQNLVEHKKLNLKTLEVLFKEKHEDLNLSYRGLKNKLIDVAKLSKVKDNTGISISIKVYDLVKVSKIEKNKTRKKFNRSTVTEKDVQKLDIYENGYIYLQSLSSMVPPLVLGAKENEEVLDMASAPGSKTTQISAMMNNTGHIFANELDKIRCERLKFNLENQGATNVEVINGRGESLGNKYPEKFDKVLLDTPCSGEGRFIAEIPSTYRNWSERTVKDLAKLQKKLIKSGYNALKPNGIMVYSTCTLNLEENENILSWALENLNLKMLDIDINIKSAIKGDNTDTFKDIDKAIKILPTREMEGFFVAKLKKVV